MAEPGDPNAPDDRAPTLTPRGHGSDDHSHDDLIGFTSPASLTGRDRSSLEPPRAAPEPEPAPRLEPALTPPPPPPPPPAAEIEDTEPDLFDDPPPRRDVPPVAPVAPVTEQAPARPSTEAPLDFDHLARTATPIAATPLPAESAAPELGAVPAWAKETTPSRPTARETAAFGRASATGPVEGSMSLYAVYALILFAVPTLGVSALIALVAVTGRPGPEQALSRSHFVFQQRTLWISAIAAVLGVVLIAVNLGVFVLFIMAVWVVVRGAFGLLALARGKAIANPRTPLI